MSPPSSSSAVADSAAIDPASTEAEKVVSLYASQQKIYAQAVSGLFAKWRWIMVWITQIVFYGLPWLQWNDRQAILFALESAAFLCLFIQRNHHLCAQSDGCHAVLGRAFNHAV
jgi:hypothetical protein